MFYLRRSLSFHIPTLHTADNHNVRKMSELNHAIVFGASGLLGWATVEQLLFNYPSEGSFKNVTALMNRPLSESASFWPPASSNRPRLQIASGVNLTGTLEDLTSQLKGKVDGVEGVTHVFYFGENCVLSGSFIHWNMQLIFWHYTSLQSGRWG